MSRGNIERMRRAIAALQGGDKDTFLPLIDPDIEVVPVGDWPEGDIRGREAAWEFFVATDEPWEPGAFAFDEVSEVGHCVAARMRRRLRGKSSGIEVDYDYWVVFTFRDGKVVRAEWFEDREQASKATGLVD